MNLGNIESALREDILDRFLSIIDTFSLQNDDLINQWEAFCINHKVTDATLQDIESFRQLIQKNFQLKMEKKLSSPNKRPASELDSDLVYTKDNIDQLVFFFFVFLFFVFLCLIFLNLFI